MADKRRHDGSNTGHELLLVSLHDKCVCCEGGYVEKQCDSVQCWEVLTCENAKVFRLVFIIRSPRGIPRAGSVNLDAPESVYLMWKYRV
jgi:hypothetical protein